MRPIDADALAEYLQENFPQNWTDSEAERQEQFDWESFIDLVDAQPTIKLKEGEHGSD